MAEGYRPPGYSEREGVHLACLPVVLQRLSQGTFADEDLQGLFRHDLPTCVFLCSLQ